MRGNNHIVIRLLRLALPLLPIVVFVVLNYANLFFPFSFVLGMIVFPFTVDLKAEKGTWRFLILASLFILASLAVQSNTLYFFATAFLFLFAIDQWWGRLNSLPVFLLIVISPVIRNMVHLWSFPIRLKLSAWTGILLNWLHLEVEVSGNMVYLEGQAFAVDPACIGLKLMITALVITIVMLRYSLIRDLKK
ncbi:MAG: archaeosortase/exosortase family protein [Bacteroidota bacterium]